MNLFSGMILLYYSCTFALFIFRLHKLGIEAHAYAHYTSLLCFALLLYSLRLWCGGPFQKLCVARRQRLTHLLTYTIIHFGYNQRNLDMHHLVFGINFQIHFITVTSLVSIHLNIHLSSHLCHQCHFRHSLLPQSFIPGSHLPFQQILHQVYAITDFWYYLDCLHGSYHVIGLFLVYFFSYIFSLILCSRLSWLPDKFLAAR